MGFRFCFGNEVSCQGVVYTFQGLGFDFLGFCFGVRIKGVVGGRVEGSEIGGRSSGFMVES